MNQRRILMVQTQAEAAGAQEVSRLLGEGLTKAGWDVHHAFLYRRTNTLDALPNSTFCFDGHPGNPIKVAKIIARLWRLCRELKPDVVCTFQHYGNLVAAPVARAAGIKTIVANRTSAATQLPKWLEVVDVVCGSTPLFTRVIINSSETEKEVDRYPRSYRKRVVRIDHGFALRDSKLSKSDARIAFNLPRHATLLGCVARLHPQKNQAAALRLLPKNPQWHLALAGQGQDQAALETMATELGCRNRLHLAGELPPERIGDFLAALDVFVFPSRAESFGLAPVEAAQAGVPVVAQDLPVLREVLSVNGEPCAVFCDAEDTSEFADAIRRLQGDRTLTEKMTSRGKKLAQKYGLDQMTTAYREMLDAAAASGRFR